MSDLHDKPFDAVVKSLKARRPDLIAVPGDLFFHILPPDDDSVLHISPHALPFLEACADIAPTFYSVGNHDWMLGARDLAILRDAGVTALDNSFVRFGDLCIGGLTSGVVMRYRLDGHIRLSRSIFRHDFLGHDSPTEPDTAWLNEFEAQDGYKLLLCHHPEYWKKYLQGRKIDLILSGHAHGGQIRLFGQGLFAPGQGWFPKYTSGIYGNMIVSRGLANTGGIIPRLFNPCEIVYIEPE